MADICEAAKALERRGFKVATVADRAAAAKYVMEQAAEARTVGFGGSMTLKETGVAEMLKAAGKELLQHGDPSLDAAGKIAVMNRQLTCDLFLLSANAVTADGRLVNIDGNGNRVAASIYGPKKTIFVVGKNKLVDGGLDDAVARIKREACPPNCRRLGRKTPCAATGECADCDSPDRICKVLAVMDRKPTVSDAHVVLVDEALGY